jgi:magnesium chelatase family protein
MDQAALREYCALDDAGSELMRRAYSALDMSARAYDRTLRLARTIADLAGSERIAVGHLAEAMSYRNQKKGLEG